MCSGSWPNFNAWLQTAWGAGGEFWASCGQFYGATNLVFGQNPPYFLDDFLAIYPKFFGSATAISGAATTNGSNVVTVPSVNGLNYGQFLQGTNLPKGTVITGIGDQQITVSTNATATGTNITLMAYEASTIPTTVIQMYLNLAYASLVEARWKEQWYVAMGWFIAHYCTLYAKSDASDVMSVLQTIIHGEVPSGTMPGTVFTLSQEPPGEALQSLTLNGLFQSPGIDYTLDGNTITMTESVTSGSLYATWPVQEQILTSQPMNGAQIAAAGLAGGIQTSKAVGDVSVSYQVLVSLEDWGTWNLTSYGQLLATMAKVVGSGPMVIW